MPATTTPSGLQYEDTVVGGGDEAKAGAYVSVHYTGWPTQSNPYESCQPSGTNNGPASGTDEYVLLHLKPAS